MDEAAVSLAKAHLRVARPTDHLTEVVQFYRDGLGLKCSMNLLTTMDSTASCLATRERPIIWSSLVSAVTQPGGHQPKTIS